MVAVAVTAAHSLTEVEAPVLRSPWSAVVVVVGLGSGALGLRRSPSAVDWLFLASLLGSPGSGACREQVSGATGRGFDPGTSSPLTLTAPAEATSLVHPLSE